MHRGDRETQLGGDGGEVRVTPAAERLLPGEQFPPYDLGVIHKRNNTSFQL
jgi:hypothetical protein